MSYVLPDTLMVVFEKEEKMYPLIVEQVDVLPDEDHKEIRLKLVAFPSLFLQNFKGFIFEKCTVYLHAHRELPKIELETDGPWKLRTEGMISIQPAEIIFDKI